ncbi:MAG: hypothetical protein DCF25_00245 [Leptolyngbya foveolarum]|uniref:Uncharacterized protein n=1 Tax=Leptolyngbya foveolarum TaxID=47253 RepID=A0A2W4V329_9CYAN|nr:MAG: hypothetical protein DCF25_00245 [Leptolyngbya foveolarum]
MHQTAQRNQPASTMPHRAESRREVFKLEANNRLVTAAKPFPYQPGHQVELLHLQAEADALILKLQAAGQRQIAQAQSL